MAEATILPRAVHVADRGRLWVMLYLAATGLVLILMMLAGLLMRLAQSGWLPLDPALFYQLMTVHGTGMVGIAALGGAAVMWHFLSAHVRLHSWVMGGNLALFLIGVVAILIADLIGGFAGGWTFLYPLPAISQGVWPVWAAVLHLLGLLLVGVGFLIWCLEVARAIIAGYGSLARGLGWHVLFAGSTRDVPPPTVVAATMVAIVTTLALIAGAAVIVMSLVNLAFPAVPINPLLAKNLIYFFGHVFINATIYMTVTVVYELLPRMTGRPWKTSRVFLAAWTVSTVMVLIIFPHHLLMDFAMPVWAAALGQVLSYVNSFPILIVTGLGALAIVHRSGLKWDLVSALLLLSMFGWMAGVIPAVIDATIAVNSVMHNTMWVPGHFHFYLLLGLLPMIFALMIHLVRHEDVTPHGSDLEAVLYALFGLGFVSMFLLGGWASVPRRWAQHLPEWMVWDQIASVMALGVIALTTVFVARFLAHLPALLREG
ncbi:cbb3-type cytochrome c oxidase subunit I [Phaeovulum sp. NW3]|uniref:cbb3-type cytochrome c oxidase subunit I n=1 Tax=Phaeovulum sp. NW3 TaxID=2934933 RepID=UPI002021B9A6|nr:cbb3-type cytochrome c oxidase subunit I [Phaeovulum sp. NW3]MCL7466566.1 cbb3-type cytochrome c oxidase subunit I [Phaeovulum sp. NW3]